MLKNIKKIDLNIIIPILIILIAGLLAVYSATIASKGAETWFQKQIFWVVIGMILMLTITIFPTEIIFKLSLPFYIITIILLIIVKITGSSDTGAARWISLGGFHFQPSEFAKISTLLMLANYFNYERKTPNSWAGFFIAVLIVIIPFFLILIEPDLGTSLVLLAFLLPILHWAGLKWITLFAIISPLFVVLSSFYFIAFLLTIIIILLILYFSKQKISIIIAVFAINIFVGLITPQLWNSLKPYQQNRIKVFIQPEEDPRGAGYQIIQSKVAIGSGGFLGKGWHKGTQVQLRFLPEQHTDFIMAVIGEEFGFLGCLIVILTFAYLLIRLLYIATNVKNRSKMLLCIGVFIILFFHIFINIGMTVGLMPVTGLPLPFLSYGGSAMFLNFSLIGFVLNSWATRYN